VLLKDLCVNVRWRMGLEITPQIKVSGSVLDDGSLYNHGDFARNVVNLHCD
jgi:hypothetical protein